MLSILIPIYNYDVRAFVKELSNQAEELEFDVEIICMDDASSMDFRTLNAEIVNHKNVRCVQSEENLGRSAVRNALVDLSRYENLLLLDCDGKCTSEKYLKNYAAEWDKYDVIYGGRVYDEEAPDDHDLYFHWYVGTLKEAIVVPLRRQNPFKSFMTNNFLIRKAVYQQIKMDETLEGYGHEDTLFAQEIKRAGMVISHINNPVEHAGIESKEIFLRKSANGVKNLAQLIKAGQVDDSIRLVRYYHKMERWRLIGLIAWLVSQFDKNIQNSLEGPAPNLLWFDLWKLGVLHHNMKNLNS
jgi:glycosyltransferase involved in cell wall biosynthesis